MSLCEQFRADLTQAMKSSDKVRLATLRLLTAAIKNRQIDKGGALDDAEALDVVRLATKQRREAIALARQYGREDIARQEEQELAILEAYLPVQLSADDLIQRIDAVIQELGATSEKDLGRVMRGLMPEVKGRADGTTVNRLVRERLTGSLSV
ncbi:MAG TPA: GatB/YqeY domain-containing protein [Candidatus Tectomicrobia bacterium]